MADREVSDVDGHSELEVQVEEEVEQPPPVVTLFGRLRSPTVSDLVRSQLKFLLLLGFSSFKQFYRTANVLTTRLHRNL